MARPKIAYRHDLRVDVTTLERQGVDITGALDSAACQLIQERFSFLDVSNAAVELRIKKVAADCWSLSGKITAAIAQACVVTGTSIAEALEISVEERFVPAFEIEAEEELEIDIHADDIEQLDGDEMAVGEAVLQHIGLAANPYPRLPDAPAEVRAGPVVEDTHPFAALSKLKN